LTSKEQAFLVLRAQAGDRGALENLLRIVQASLTRYVRSIVGQTGADDVTQEVLIAIYRKIWWLSSPDLFRPWMFRIASRAAFRHLKRERKWPPNLRDDEALEDVAIDGYRRRWVWTFGITAALSQAAWIALVMGSKSATERQLILLAALAVAMTVFGGVFMLVLLIFRMTHKLLQAMEITARRG
jgi:DNA-directed RNA polymerase specialized sigma24 family protein